MIQDAWGWCTGMTQKDGMGRGFRMGSTCTPVVPRAPPWEHCPVEAPHLDRPSNPLLFSLWWLGHGTAVEKAEEPEIKFPTSVGS